MKNTYTHSPTSRIVLAKVYSVLYIQPVHELHDDPFLKIMHRPLYVEVLLVPAVSCRSSRSDFFGGVNRLVLEH